MEHTTAIDQAGAGGGARRRRPLLASLTTLGLAAGLVGVTGFFAAGSDSASTGTNEANSGEVDFADVDLLLSPATYDEFTGTFTCVGEFSDDLTTGVLTEDGRSATEADDRVNWYGAVCVHNAGDTIGTLSVSAIDVVDREIGCSEGEAAVDASCGLGTGELSRDLGVDLMVGELGTPGPEETNCSVYAGQHPDIEAGLTPTVAGMATEILPLGQIEPGETRGLCAIGVWNAEEDSERFVDSQSDQTTWRFRFDSELSSEDPDPGPGPCVDDAAEENDFADDAAYIDDPEYGIEAMACEDDPDVWFLEASEEESDGTRTITLDWASDASDLDLAVYDAVTNAFLGVSEASQTTHEEVTVPAGRDVHIVVTPYAGPWTRYSLGVRLNPAP